ncbi:uncharacterized protein BDV17DRAFT_295275 [Aspergillus undulatus]|uniref:uncharacterized protein n=1 Tax=Aspergillus undulatus TaxID=1810928 RepID=UPI003CCDB425
MGKPSIILGNQKRAWWRTKCRQRLADHIRETLGIEVTPTEVRLLEAEDMRYSWKVKEPSLNLIFQKNLSKHSVRAYMRLYNEVGKSFHATEREITSPVGSTPPATDTDESSPEPSEEICIQKLIEENTRLAEDLDVMTKKAKAVEEARVLAENNIKIQEVMLQEAQAAISFHQHDAQQWMAVAETYQNSCIQCSNALSQLINLTEGIQSRVSIALPKE